MDKPLSQTINEINNLLPSLGEFNEVEADDPRGFNNDAYRLKYTALHLVRLAVYLENKGSKAAVTKTNAAVKRVGKAMGLTSILLITPEGLGGGKWH